MLKLLRVSIASLALALGVAACGDGYVGVAVPVSPGPPPVAGLGLQLTRVGPEAVQLDWSYDEFAFAYDVFRNGGLLVSVGGTSIVDTSVLLGSQVCYQVVGRQRSGAVVSQSQVGCLTVF